VLKFWKNLSSAAATSLLDTPAEYPATMAEMVEFLVLLQVVGTGTGSSAKGNRLRIAITLSEDPYCLGYLSGMFDALCQHGKVPAAERRLIIGRAYALMFRDLLDGCADPRYAAAIEAAAFTRSLTLTQDPDFRRGQFDGCTELVRYAATRERAHLPVKMHAHLKAQTAA